MKLSVQHKIRAGFGLALALLILTGVVAWWSAQRSVETFCAVDHTYQVLDRTEGILIEMLNTEAGTRSCANRAEPTTEANA